MRKRMLCPVIASALLMTGCQSGPPECSDPQTLEIFHDLQQQGATIMAPMLVTQVFPEVGFYLMRISPEWWAKMANGMFDDAEVAYAELVEIVAAAEQGGRDENEPLLRALKATVDAAQWSSVSVSDVTTLDRTEHRTMCSATVSHTFGFPSTEDLGLDGGYAEMVDSKLKIVRSMTLDIDFSTYYSDDGTHFVELDE